MPYRERLDELEATSDPERAAAPTASSQIAAALSESHRQFLAAHGSVIEFDGSATMAAWNAGASTAAAAGGAENDGASPSSSAAAAAAEAAQYLVHSRIKERGLFARPGLSDKQTTSHPQWRLATALRAAHEVGGAARVEAMAAHTAQLGAAHRLRGAENATRSLFCSTPLN